MNSAAHSFAQETVTVAHVDEDSPARDEYGNVVAGATTTQTTCYRWQQSRGEIGLDNIERERWAVIFFDPALQIDANDYVTFADGDYQVIGMPWRAEHPLTGEVDHIEATIERRR